MLLLLTQNGKIFSIKMQIYVARFITIKFNFPSALSVEKKNSSLTVFFAYKFQFITTKLLACSTHGREGNQNFHLFDSFFSRVKLLIHFAEPRREAINLQSFALLTEELLACDTNDFFLYFCEIFPRAHTERAFTSNWNSSDLLESHYPTETTYIIV